MGPFQLVFHYNKTSVSFSQGPYQNNIPPSGKNFLEESASVRSRSVQAVKEYSGDVTFLTAAHELMDEQGCTCEPSPFLRIRSIKVVRLRRKSSAAKVLLPPVRASACRMS
jgi:hypothetical protein